MNRIKNNRYKLEIYDVELLANGIVPDGANVIETKYYKTLLELQKDLNISLDMAKSIWRKEYLGDRKRKRKENKWRNNLLTSL